jgi:DNA-binding NtrC family response regulator
MNERGLVMEHVDFVRGGVNTAAVRTVVLASADAELRTRLKRSLSELRWNVYEASGGAEAMAQMEDVRPAVLLMDSWLPDLEASEFAGQVSMMYPSVELIGMNGVVEGGAKSPRHHELLHALREVQGGVTTDTAAWNAAPVSVPAITRTVAVVARSTETRREAVDDVRVTTLLPEMVGSSEPMRELAELIRLVAPRSSTVLIEGETGTGKEVVAKAIHRLSDRVSKPFVVLNCAAIPEALLEAELFGHTRGAFTGAVQSRTGRIEAAHGGTLFLDEIGEMPLALQAKMLRFLEYGELQRVGDNETMRVDVRVVAATHQPLEQRAEEKSFRLDLYHRLAVFPVEVPPLRARMEDVPALAEHILAQLGQKAPRKRIAAAALDRLQEHYWPGNVRELMHVLERAAILSADRMEIGPDEIRYRRATR